MSSEAVPVTGVWLQKDTDQNGGQLRVLVEVAGEWRLVITDTADDGPISHIVEPRGIEISPVVEYSETAPVATIRYKS